MLTLLTDVDMTLRLYKTDVTAGLSQAQIDALDETDFAPATFPGYAAVSMTTSWTVTEGNPTTATRAAVSFTRSSTGTAELIHGYYVTRNSDDALMWFEQFDGPVSMEFASDQLNVTPTITLDDPGGNAVQTGTITAFGGTTPPTGWLLCQGQAVSRTTFAELFAVLGTAFGNGDGSTTFNVPDLRQRFPLGKATAGTGATLGGTGGTIDHTHGLDTSSSHAKIATKATVGNEFHMRRKTVTTYTATHGMTAANHQTDTNSQTVGAELGGTSGTGNPPFQAVNFIVKA